jgi:hypothetical protein
MFIAVRVKTVAGALIALNACGIFSIVWHCGLLPC